MADIRNNPQAERQRLGGWLPSKEAHLARYREEMAARARERGFTRP